MHQGAHQRDPSPGSLAPPSSSDHMLHQMMHNQHPPQNQHPVSVTQPPQQLRIPSPHANGQCLGFPLLTTTYSF